MASDTCGATSFWNGPLSAKLVCGRNEGHTGCHVAFLPRLSVGFTDDFRDGTVALATTDDRNSGRLQTPDAA